MLAGCSRNQPALGAPAYRARKMTERRGAAAAWQNKILERRQLRVVPVEQLLQTRDVCWRDALVARDGKLTAQLEEIMLNADQCLAQILRQRLGEQQADTAVELVHGADGFHSGAVLGDARAVAQAGFTTV